MRAAFAAFAVAALLALAPTALAAPPVHKPLPSLDVANLNHACGAAADNKGDLYAASAGEGEIEVFAPADHTTPIATIANANEPCALAVTTTGSLYVSELKTKEVVRYKPNAYPLGESPSYGAREVIDASGKAKGISVDPVGNRLYVAEGEHVSVYNAEGTIEEIDEVQKVIVANASGGTFTLSFEESAPTPPINYNATFEELKAALEKIPALTGNIEVKKPATAYIITFVGALASTAVPLLEADDSALEGSGSQRVAVQETTKGFDGYVGEGDLGEATGVAPYSYTDASSSNRRLYLAVADAKEDSLKFFSGQLPSTQKLRRTVTGVDADRNPETPDQTFGFGAAGAYPAADPGNESGTHGCTRVGSQACTAGHLFLYDAAHEALDELDATGEFLDQIAGIAGGEPTQVAVERSGGANDGTLYVSSGPEAGAKLAAYAPLTMPTRAALPTLSHTLAKAQAVAVDDHGDVYVSTQTAIHVYSPEGKQLTEFEDAENSGASDLAVDSEGHVYVVDGINQMTYYTPSAYPPTGSTTYSRHTPSLVPTEAITLESGLAAVAVNPANDHPFVYRRTLAATQIFEFGTSGEGSPLKAECGEGINLPGNSTVDMDVYGKTGEIYLAVNPRQVWVVQCGAKPELIREAKGGGCPSGEWGSNPSIAIDQANGHLAEFATNQSGEGARENEGVGACVAEFGNGEFSSSVAPYRVALDNSCAIHKPEPLAGKACEEFDPASGNAYVAFDSSNNVAQPYDLNAFGPLEYGEPPKVETGIASEVGPGGARLNGTLDPRGSLYEECEFEYLTEVEYEENLSIEKPPFEGAASKDCAESAKEVGTELEPVPVHAKVSGIEPQSTRYRFRLVAENTYGPAEPQGKAWPFGPPSAQAKQALPVGYREATLRGVLDPAGLKTTYRFDYIPEAQYVAEGESFAAAQSTPEEALAPGDEPVAVGAPLTGLAEGTAYRLRLVASNEAAEDSGKGEFETLVRRVSRPCLNAEYRTGLSANLPDCRAYELVTPANTGGAGASTASSGRSFNSWWVKPRGEGAGDSVGFAANLPGFDGTGKADGYVAKRGAGAHPEGGWSTQIASPSFAQTGGSGVGFSGVSSDQAYWLFSFLGAPTPSKKTFPLGNYLRVPAGQADPACGPGVGDPQLEYELVGCGPEDTDLKAQGRYASPGGSHVIFSSTKHLEEEAPPEGTEAIYDRPAGFSSAQVLSTQPDGSPFGAGEGATYIASTEDGTAVVFEVKGALYAHREGETVEVAEAPNTYAGISTDGRRVFYIAANYSEGVPGDLYACDIGTGPCTGEGAHAPIPIAEDSIFVNVSPDGTHAFFTSEEALSAEGEENEGEEHAEAGHHNLYAWHDTGTSFVGQIATTDFSPWEGVSDPMTLSDWPNAIPGQRISDESDHLGRALSPTRSTPGGEAFVFQSHAQLSAYDNEGVGEIYRYAPGGIGATLACISCPPGGAPPDGTALLQSFAATRPDTLIPNVTDDGTEVFFQTPDRLLPEDANEVTDVYEWQAMGAGEGVEECKRPGGCLALISSGQGEEDSFLYGMSADGHDVFFTTFDELVGSDIPGDASIYDARVQGGIPYLPPDEPCQGSACQGAGSSPPTLPALDSIGPGTKAGAPVAKHCPKHKHRAKERCVPKHRHRKHRRHHKHRRAKHRAHHNGRARR
jgi:hypothetical protein